MNILKNRLIIVVIFCLLSACEGIPKKTNSSGAFNIVQTIVDIAQKTSVSPSSNDLLTYSESDQFDLDLLASMKGKVDPITVQMNGLITRTQLNKNQPITAATPRIERWLWKISHSEGEVIACKEGSRALLAIIIPIVIGLVADFIQDYVTYKPAKDYNSKIFYWADTEVINRVVFYRRNQEPFTCD